MTVKTVKMITKDIGVLDLSPITEDIVFNDGVKLFFGTDKDAWFTWNNTAQKFELWVKGVRKGAWSL